MDKAYHKKYRQKQENKDRDRDRRYRQKYGITLGYYNQMLEEQNNSCALCERPKTTFGSNLAVDHNHKSGKVRGLVCYYCNKFQIGRQTASKVRKLMAYFEKYDPES